MKQCKLCWRWFSPAFFVEVKGHMICIHCWGFAVDKGNEPWYDDFKEVKDG